MLVEKLNEQQETKDLKNACRCVTENCQQECDELTNIEQLEEDRVAQLEAELSCMQKKLETTNQQLLRVAADFENYRKRMQREKTEIYQQANAGLVRRLLPVLDSFSRALKTDDEEQGMNQGLQKIGRQMLAILEGEGLECIKAQGCCFDPNYHEAVMRSEDPEVPENTVLEVFEEGYLFNGKLCRPSMVRVSRK